MNVNTLLKKLEQQPNSVEFDEVIGVIDANYEFKPTTFLNGETSNEKGTNSGSCKILAFGLLNKLSEDQTLACFGTYYREDVLKHPKGVDHANIRNFIKTGWGGVKFSSSPLSVKKLS